MAEFDTDYRRLALVPKKGLEEVVLNEFTSLHDMQKVKSSSEFQSYLCRI